MRANFRQRFLAYILDFFLLWLFTMAILSIIPESNASKHIATQIEELTETYLAGNISSKDFVKQYIPLSRDYDKENMAVNISNLLFILVYFIIYPFYHEGQTLGKKVLHLKIKQKENKLTIRTLIFRNFFTTSLFTLMLGSALIYLVPASIYFYITSFFTFLQFLLVILSSFMIIYRKDKRGVHDCILRTYVVVE